MYELAQDEQMENDEVHSNDDISILVNPDSKKYLEGDIIIDYKQNYGYVLKNSYEILTFGMKLRSDK
jgi:Fe-S cluster assembly iron-binding protein IscA